MWTVVSQKNVTRRIERIPEPEKGRIRNAIANLESGPDGKDIRSIIGRKDYRLRVGDWRIILEIDETNNVITLTDIHSRGEAYKQRR